MFINLVWGIFGVVYFVYLIWLLGPIPAWLVLFLSSSDTSGIHILLPLAVVALTLIILMRARKQSAVSNGYFPRLPYLLPLIGLYVSSMPLGIPLLLFFLD